MHEEHKRKEERELIRKYEAFVKNKENHYFDEEGFVQIISHTIQAVKNINKR